MNHTLAQLEMMRLQQLRPSTTDRTLPARRLAEFRCQPKGHLLAVIYDTPAGPLAVSTADATMPAEQMAGRNQQVRRFADDNPGIDWNPKRLGWRPSPRLIGVAEPFSDDPVPLNCRCGVWPPLSADHLAAAVRRAGLGPKSPMVLSVSHSGPA